VRAAVLKKANDLRIEDVPRPILASQEVMVKVEACGICGSDIRYFHGENPWALHTLGEGQENPPNIIMGHEFAGEVVEVASDRVSHLLGKRVVVAPYKSCQMCRFCRAGRYHLCESTTHHGHGAGWGKREYYPGGMAEFCQVWEDKVYVLPDSISYEEATMLDVAGVGIHALGISEISPGSTVLIIGVGPLGASLVQTSRIWGAKRVFCTDISEKLLQLALNTGADQALNAEKDDIVALIMKQTNDLGVDVIFDTVCLSQTQEQALRMLAPGGTLVSMAINSNKVSFRLMDLGGERSIRSSCNYLFPEFQIGVDLAAAGRLKLQPLITHRFPLEEAGAAFETVINRKDLGAMKVVVLPQSIS